MLFDKSKESPIDSKSELNTSIPSNKIKRSDLQLEVRKGLQEGSPIKLPTLEPQKLDPRYSIPFDAEEGPVTGRSSQPRHPISGMVYFGPTDLNKGDVASQSMIDDLRKAGFKLTAVATYQIEESGKVRIVGWRLEASRTITGPDGKPQVESYSEDVLVGNPPRKEPSNNQVPTSENLKDPLKAIHSKIQQGKESGASLGAERTTEDNPQVNKERFNEMMELMMGNPVGIPFKELEKFLSPPPSSEKEWKLLIVLLGVCKDTDKGDALNVLLSKLKDPAYGHSVLGALKGILKRGELSPEAIETMVEHLPFLMEFLEEEKSSKGDLDKKASRFNEDTNTGAMCGEASLITSSLIDMLVTNPKYASAAKQVLVKYAEKQPSPEKEQMLDGIANIEKAQKLGLIPPSVASLRYLGELVRNRESPEQDSRPVAEVIYSGHDPQGAFTTDVQRNIDDLIKAGYKVVVHRVNNEEEVRSALQQRAKLGGADLLFVIGHGTPDGIRLGGKTDSPLQDPPEEFMFDTNDAELNKPEIAGAVKQSGTVVLLSCSTGKTSSDDRSNMGHFMRQLFPQAGTVIAPDANISGMIFEFNPEHRITGARFEQGNAVKY